VNRAPTAGKAIEWLPTPTIGLLLFALVSVQLLAAWGSDGSYDTIRDMFFARQIATGAEFPLNGPLIGGIFHLGPGWFYLLAPAFGAAGMVGVVVAIGVLIGLKFPIAYLIGLRMAGPRAGVFCALGLAIPGWSLYEAANLTHVSLVQTTLLLAVLAAIHARERRGGWSALLLGACCGLAVQAHPSSLLLATIAMLWGLGAPSRDRGYWLRLLLAGGAAVAPMLPYVIAQLGGGFPDAPGIGRHGETMLAAGGLASVPRLLFMATWGGVEHIATYWWGFGAGAMWALRAAGVAFAALLLLGLVVEGIHDRRHARLAGVLLAILLAHTVFVLAIRPITPVWMVFAYGVPLGFLFALATQGLWRARIGRAAAVAMGACAAAGFIAGSMYFVAPTPVVRVPLPPPGGSGLMDIDEAPVGTLEIVIPRLGWRDLQAIAAPLCAPSSVHGHYGQFIEKSHTVAVAQACGSYSQVRLGGGPTAGRRAHLGLTEHAATALGLRPNRWIGALALFDDFEVLVDHHGLPLVEPRTHGARQLSGVVAEFTLQLSAKGGDAILVSHLAPGYFPFAVTGAALDGVAIAPSYADPAHVGFVCAACSAYQQVQWTLRIEAVRDLVDIVRIDAVHRR
jgi:hypothetical protein